jgi:hypothetical protein
MIMDDYEKMDAPGGSASAYIARWDEPQPSDQTDMKQWSRCIIEISWRLPYEGDPPGRGARPAVLTCGAGRPHLAAVGPPLRSVTSGVFYVLLVPLSDLFT